MCAVSSLASKCTRTKRLRHGYTKEDLKKNTNNEYREGVELETKNRFDRHDIKIGFLGARNGSSRYEEQKVRRPRDFNR